MNKISCLFKYFATKGASGTSKNKKDSPGKRLGIKRVGG